MNAGRRLRSLWSCSVFSTTEARMARGGRGGVGVDMKRVWYRRAKAAGDQLKTGV
jgi:hypothetical protein